MKKSLDLALPKTKKMFIYIILGSKLSISAATVFGMSGFSIQNRGVKVKTGAFPSVRLPSSPATSSVY